ncbi:unnamed protein product [Meganyctiphanes norvegica]|uniref:Golgin-84 n=1 Tax=Meganyctiphanes norvegica TaxID=48144 RepID=A0AAV2R2D4_MEGNR
MVHVHILMKKHESSKVDKFTKKLLPSLRGHGTALNDPTIKCNTGQLFLVHASLPSNVPQCRYSLYGTLYYLHFKLTKHLVIHKLGSGVKNSAVGPKTKGQKRQNQRAIFRGAKKIHIAPTFFKTFFFCLEPKITSEEKYPHFHHRYLNQDLMTKFMAKIINMVSAAFVYSWSKIKAINRASINGVSSTQCSKTPRKYIATKIYSYVSGYGGGASFPTYKTDCSYNNFSGTSSNVLTSQIEVFVDIVINESLAAKDSQLAVLRIRLQEGDTELETKSKQVKEIEKENQRIGIKHDRIDTELETCKSVLRPEKPPKKTKKESLAAKDSQLAVLRIRLQEGDTELETKSKQVKEIEKENQRLIHGVNESSGLHNHTIHTLEQRLEEVQGALGREKQLHINSQQDLTERISKNEQELQLLTAGLTEASRRFEEEKTKSQQLNSQMTSLKTELTASRNELTEYKAKAGRILQSKEKLITSLKEGRFAEDPQSQETSEFLKEELEQIRQERDLLREELDEASERCKQLRADILEIEDQAGEESRSATSQIQQLENELKQEESRRTELEKECQQSKQEIRCSTEELTKQKVSLSSRIQERDQQIDRLRKQIAHKQSSSSSQAELEQRIHALTESLIHKQTTIETLNTEKHSLVMQMERLQKNYDDSQQMLNRDQPLPYHHQDEVRNRVPSYLVESPFDGGITLRVKRAYTTLDKFSVRLGVFLRRYPIARVFVIVYMMLLHVWVMIVLLTYTPEIHGPEFHKHKPAATLPHE